MLVLSYSLTHAQVYDGITQPTVYRIMPSFTNVEGAKSNILIGKKWIFDRPERFSTTLVTR